ncbi:hypothetical protein MKT69_00050, partial [Leptospira borgpetersenii]|uniref:hypothetical protein n=1 Tax=Leptospira borgpetersenii TaxID=174 RepID=UPI0027DCBA3A
ANAALVFCFIRKIKLETKISLLLALDGILYESFKYKFRLLPIYKNCANSRTKRVFSKNEEFPHFSERKEYVLQKNAII